MRAQAQEEMVHAMKFYDYVNERGGRVILGPIEAPPSEWESAVAVFDATYKHEQKVTGLINDLVDLAIEEKDHATNNLLQWFVSEQVEEEASASGVLNKAKLTGDAPGGLFMLDQELGARVFTMPVAAGQG
jgi:ferritin